MFLEYAVECQYWQVVTNGQYQRNIHLIPGSNARCTMDSGKVLNCSRSARNFLCIHRPLKGGAHAITTDVSLSPFDDDEYSKILDLVGGVEGKQKIPLLTAEAPVIPETRQCREQRRRPFYFSSVDISESAETTKMRHPDTGHWPFQSLIDVGPGVPRAGAMHRRLGFAMLRPLACSIVLDKRNCPRPSVCYAVARHEEEKDTHWLIMLRRSQSTSTFAAHRLRGDVIPASKCKMSG
ncbi:hypothetical protein BDR03DRAFT_996983 [Suillus americanus]|nr:hypothetical protein BDR03DRAFT_996983 [Suillus americanus]